MLAEFSLLQWGFLIALVGLLGASGLFLVYLVARMFVNPARTRRRA